MKPILWTATIIMILASCKTLPKEKISQINLEIDVNVENDTLRLALENTVDCPIRFYVKTTDSVVGTRLEEDFPILIYPRSKMSYIHPTSKSKEELGLSFNIYFGNPMDSIRGEKISMPFPKGRSYKILQAYNGKLSHYTPYSRYALDFDMKIGDTICVAADGVVIGVVEGYKYGGNDKKWRDYANFITVFHPSMNLYTQYVHLVQNGSLVEIGDHVKRGEVIAISGDTGFGTVEHLHFNVLRPVKDGMESYPLDFIEGYKGHDLKAGDIVTK